MHYLLVLYRMGQTLPDAWDIRVVPVQGIHVLQTINTGSCSTVSSTFPSARFVLLPGSENISAALSIVKTCQMRGCISVDESTEQSKNGCSSR
jgi:hypothetical protein